MEASLTLAEEVVYVRQVSWVHHVKQAVDQTCMEINVTDTVLKLREAVKELNFADLIWHVLVLQV
ncbi:hypothetical protein C0J52_28070 [Blattella germanica]|nr:hypothetical protein C0J52_28070 [Blattella germanica]